MLQTPHAISSTAPPKSEQVAECRHFPPDFQEQANISVTLVAAVGVADSGD